MFRVGQKVVCVKGGEIDRAVGHEPLFGLPEKGLVYTVKALIYSPFYECNNAVLVELPNPWMNDPSYDAGWLLERFRPAVDIKDDIALFHALCPGLPVVPPAVVPKRVTAPSHSD